MEQVIERVAAMEKKLDMAVSVLEKEDISLDDVLSVQPVITELAAYYSSTQWMMDFEADEKGMLPETLKRGVLSEDGIYNLLLKNKEILEYKRGQK